MSKKIWIAGVLTLAVALVAASAVAAAPVADPQGPGGDPQGQQGPGGPRGRGGFPQVNGEITTIGDDQLTLQVADDVEITVLVSDSTVYFGSLNSFANLAVGDEIAVAGGHAAKGDPAADPNADGAPAEPPSDANGQPDSRGGQRSLDARLIALSDEVADSMRAGGEVTEVSGSTLSIQTRDDETLEIAVSNDTIFMSRDDAVQSVDDISVGDHAQVIYSEASNGDLNAVLILAGGAPDGAGPDGRQNGAAPQNDSSSDDSQQGTGSQG